MQEYFVGGYVRDELMGVKSKDIDILVVGATWSELLTELEKRGTVVWQTRPEFLTVRGHDPELGPVDYVLARKDGAYSDGRHPDYVAPGTLLEDLSRRDFTMNAIAKHRHTGELVDPHGGREDLAKQVIRTVGKAEDRFTEDPLRILRAVRFELTKNMMLAINILYFLEYHDLNTLLHSVSPERIYEEVRKMFDWGTLGALKKFGEHKKLQRAVFSRINLKPLVKGNLKCR